MSQKPASAPASLPTEAEHFKAGYQVWLGAVLLILGLVGIVTGLGLLLNGDFSGVLIVGLLAAIAGVLYLTRPYFAIAPNRLTVYRLTGKVAKRYPFAAFEDISIEGNQVYICIDSQREPVKIAKWMVKTADWQTLQAIARS